MKKKFFAFVMAVLLVLSAFPAAVFADVSGDKTSAEKQLTKDKRQTEVSIRLPSAEYHYEYDIVFCMDSSTSTVNSQLDFAGKALEMLGALDDHDAIINVGVVKFRGVAFDTVDLATEGALKGLVRFTEENASDLQSAINYAEADLKKLASGTNVHAGLEMASALLAADTDVADDHKFIILLTDGKSYIWNDEEGNPTSNYTQWHKHYVIADSGKAVINQNAGCYDKENYGISESVKAAFLTENDLEIPATFWFDTYAGLYASNSTDLTAKTKYDQLCKYALKQGSPDGTVVARTTTNGSDIFPNNIAGYLSVYEFTPNADFADMAWYEANPFEYTVNEDGTATILPVPNPDFYQWHPDALQKGLYKAGHLWTELDEKYNTAVVTYDGWGGAQGLSIAKSFDSWIRDNSDIGVDITETEKAKALFKNIENKILYMVEQGTLVDIIPEEFTLVGQELDTFRITVGGVKLTAQSAGENVWNFGTAVDGVYPYIVSFDTARNTITWQINVPVENAKPVTLSYTLEIDADAENGDHDTNVSAILTYTSTDDPDKNQYTYTMPVPEVEYYLPVPTEVVFSGTKSLVGKPDSDSFNPTFFITLSDKDGSVLDEAEIVRSGAYAFDALRFEMPGVYNYTVQETPGQEEDIEYDTKVYRLTVTVTDNGSGVLAAAISGSSTTGTDLNFTNHVIPATGSHLNEFLILTLVSFALLCITAYELFGKKRTVR